MQANFFLQFEYVNYLVNWLVEYCIFLNLYNHTKLYILIKLISLILVELSLDLSGLYCSTNNLKRVFYKYKHTKLYSI